MFEQAVPSDPPPARPPERARGRLKRYLWKSAEWGGRCAAALAGALLLALLIRSGVRAHEKNVALWARAEVLTAECRRLEERRASLSCEACALDQDPFYVEKRIRQDWSQMREGELILERPNRR